MSTSGTMNYNQSAGDIIRAALLLLGVIHPEQPISTATNNVCLDALNRMIKHWQMQGAHLWTQNGATILLNNGTSSYILPSSALVGGSVGVMKSSALVSTTVTTAASIGNTIINVASTTGISATNIICLVQDGNVRLDTTVTLINSATQLTIATPLTATMAVGQAIYAYSASVNESVLPYARQIINVRLKTSDNFERFLTPMSREDYLRRPDKTIVGSPISFYIDDQLANKVMYVYPVPSDLSETIKFTYMKELDDVTVLTNNVEFPAEWLRALVWNHAADIAVMFGKDDKLNTLAPIAGGLLRDALDWDDEKVDIQISPDFGDW